MRDRADDLIQHIYEAGALPDRWPTMLGALSKSVGAKGAILMRHRGTERTWILSPSIRPLMRQFVDEGWMASNTRIDRYNTAQPYAGFQIDDDFMPRAEFERWPIYRDFFIPHGLATGAGTVVQGAKDDGLLITVEGLGNVHEAQAKLPSLDRMRPHIARAALLSAQFELRKVEAAVVAFQLIGAAAAMLDRAGRIRAANEPFRSYLGTSMFDQSARLRLADRAADLLCEHAIGEMALGNGGCSIPVRRQDTTPIVLHLIPIEGVARDVFSDIGSIGLVIDPAARTAPQSQLGVYPLDIRNSGAYMMGHEHEAPHHNAVFPPVS